MTPPRRRGVRCGVVVGAGAWSLLIFGMSSRTPQELVAQSQAPHIVVCLTDDHGWADVPWNAVDAARDAMPFIASLENEGLRLENYYAAPTCSPSRAMLLTGRHANQLGIDVSWGSLFLYPTSTGGLGPDEDLLPELLERAKPGAYYKAAVGKWHLGCAYTAYVPTQRGFDSFRGFYSGKLDNWTTHEVSTFGPVDWTVDEALRGHTKQGHFANATTFVDWTTSEPEYSTFAFARWAAEAVETAQRMHKRLFLYLAWNAPHSPVQVPVDLDEEARDLMARAETRNRGILLASLLLVDRGVRRLYETLGDTSNLVFFFASDNGARNGGASNFPLRGEKDTFWDGGYKVPAFLWVGTALRTLPRRYTGLVHVTDVLPTLLGGFVAGDDVQYRNPVYGRDLSAAFYGLDSNSRRTDILYAFTYDVLDLSDVACTFRTESHKALLGGQPYCNVGDPRICSAVTCANEAPANQSYVFEISNDISETANIAHRVDLVDFQATCDRYIADLATPWLPFRNEEKELVAHMESSPAFRRDGTYRLAPWHDGLAPGPDKKPTRSVVAAVVAAWTTNFELGLRDLSIWDCSSSSWTLNNNSS